MDRVRRKPFGYKHGRFVKRGAQVVYRLPMGGRHVVHYDVRTGQRYVIFRGRRLVI